MITDNRRIRLISLALALIILFSMSLVACKSESSFGFNTVGEMLGTAETEAVMECEVVYPKGSSADVVMAARELADLLADQTEMRVTSHRYESKYDPEKLYVVIGRVSDDVTEYWYDGMREKDYVCRVYKNTVAIGGMTDGATLEAIQRFVDEILPAAEYGYIADEGVLFEFTGNYDTDTENNADTKTDAVILNGCGLGEYNVVYTHVSLMDLAKHIGEGIEKKTKYTLDISVCDPRDSAREIIVRINEEIGPLKYRIYNYGDDIFVESDSIFGVSLAIEKFLERIPEVTDGETKELKMIGEELFSYLNYGLAVASYRINESVGAGNSDLKTVCNAIKQRGTDIITVMVPSKNVWNAMNVYFHNDYHIRLFECDGDMIAVLSRPNMTVVDRVEVKTENEMSIVKINVTCMDKKYGIFSLYPSEKYDPKKCQQTIEGLLGSSEDSSVCIVATAPNDVTSMGFDDTESYLCAVDSIVSSGAAKYRICVLTSLDLDCYEKDSLGETEGRYVGAFVNVRNGVGDIKSP